MHLRVLALDLDGTLAEDGVVAPETWTTLRRAKDAGLALLLVTGRTLDTFASGGPFAETFEAIVAEDGAVVYFPRNDSVMLPFGRLAPELRKRLDALDIPLERGTAIDSTRLPHDEQVLRVLRETGGGATVEYNKGAVMVLPPGATKGTGLQVALQELGYSPRSVLACGDAENDRSLFELAELSVAVGNTPAEMKSVADAVLADGDGKGVRGLVDDLVGGRLPSRSARPERRLFVGREPDLTPVHMDAFSLVQGNLAIVGSSATGKSWLAGLLAEELLKLGYQICIIDPEGDYRGLRAFAHTLLPGGPDLRLPPVVDVSTLNEYSNVSLILDLSAHSPEERSVYVSDLLRALAGLRGRRGRPHWFLIDEIHGFCPPEGGPLTELIVESMREGGFAVVSYRPSQVAPSLLAAVDQWMLTRMRNPEELELVQRYLPPSCRLEPEDLAAQTALPVGQVRLCEASRPNGRPALARRASFQMAQRLVPHVRHLQKYLRAPLPEARRFYFHLEGGHGRPRVAASLWELRDALGELPIGTLRYHLDRGDFERWVRDVLRDPELARRLHKLAGRRLPPEELREAMVATVASRYEELESLI
jgi:hydroxymethylpyrimidine pyrophosphatase-like HAD family hydrolase